MQLNAAAAKYVQSNVNINTQQEIDIDKSISNMISYKI